MEYLDFGRLEALDPVRFQEQAPYPWINPEHLLTPAAFERLYANLPDIAIFDRLFDKQRRAGQKPHDRYALEHRNGISVPEPWLDFIAELKGDRYRRALCRLIGIRSLSMSFHWHYTPNGCSVSPHCDSTRKIGSHIFYFNTKEDWDPAWGGETVVLDDGGRLHRRSAPSFEAFDRTIPSQAMGNHSLIFARRGNSWHGVREIRCPEGRMRKVFIVVLNRDGLGDRIRFALTRRNVARY